MTASARPPLLPLALLATVLLAACGGSGPDAGPDAGRTAVTPAPNVVDATAPAPSSGAPDGNTTGPAAMPVPKASASGPILHEPTTAGGRVWTVNPDNDSVTLIDAASLQRLAEIPVGRQPRSLARAPDGRIWVVNRAAASISVIDPTRLQVTRTIGLPRASQPFGLVFSPADGRAWLTLAATGELVRLSADGASITGRVAVGDHPRHLSMTADGRRVLVSRFISPPLPGEDTAMPEPVSGGITHGGEVVVVDAAAAATERTIVLAVSDKTDTTLAGRGVPNYLGAVAIAPDGLSGWVPSKQDNVMRGLLRDGQPLDFQNTVRAISSRIVLGEVLAEDHVLRVDHDNAGLATAALFDPTGAYLFVALETSRQIALVDPSGGRELRRVDTGRAPQGLALSDDGRMLFVHNFMDRTVGAYDVSTLAQDQAIRPLGTVMTVGADRLTPRVLAGKQFFYDARDPRLARDGYLSCATCHADGAGDGRTWDFTGFGEGLRNTISLIGRGGGHRPLHWSGNFDELQDFEGQIRVFAQGTGLMRDEDFHAGTRSQALGQPKAGLSDDLDALAAYMASLDRFEPSPLRAADGTLTPDAQAGKALFATAGCLTCHGAVDFTDASGTLRDIGTLKPTSGGRLGGPLDGIDTPTLRDAWASGPWLHDGSAPTIAAAIRAHASATALGDADLARLAAYVSQIGDSD